MRSGLSRCRPAPTARFLSWRQVQALLRENAQLRGDKVPETAPDGPAGVGHGRSTLTAADVVTNRLVTFTSIAEIQQKNLELLAVQRTPRLARSAPCGRRCGKA